MTPKNMKDLTIAVIIAAVTYTLLLALTPFAQGKALKPASRGYEPIVITRPDFRTNVQLRDPVYILPEGSSLTTVGAANETISF